MKTILSLSVAVAMFLATPGKSQQNNNSDDGVYTAPSNTPSSNQTMSPADQSVQSAPAPQPSSPTNGDQYARSHNQVDSSQYTSTDNYYSDDYNNDYTYSSRLRRYDDSWGDWGYYDDVYTNTYWYNYNPYAFGVSIYSPWYYNPYAPFFGYGVGFGFGWGWANPYWGFGWGYPYWGGGFGCGFGGFGRWNGYNNFYYNSYEGNGGYVNPRGTGVPAVGVGANGKVAPGPGSKAAFASHTTTAASFGENYENAVHNEVGKNSEGFVKSTNGAVHVAPAMNNVHNIARTGGAVGARPVVSYRNNNGVSSNINTGARTNANAARGNANYNRGNNNTAARGNYASRPTYSRGSYGTPARVAPSQGSRSNGNYNYHPSNSGSRSYGGGGSHSFGGSSGASYHSSGGGHSFGGGSSGGGHSSGGGGGGHAGGGHR